LARPLQDNLETIATLLGLAANIDAADSHGCTALAYAARAGSANNAAKLLDAHADVNTVDEDEKTPLTIAARYAGWREERPHLLARNAPTRQNMSSFRAPVPARFLFTAWATRQSSRLL
jgi:ankyrin repeat protein